MKVFVTGNRGRIGAVIEEQLTAQGHTVVGFDRADGQSVLDGQAVRAAAQGCDAAIHLASLLGGPKDDPDETMQVSLMGPGMCYRPPKRSRCSAWSTLAASTRWGSLWG